MRDFLDPAAPAIARAFQQAGYATAHFGKWHMGGGRDVGDAPLPAAVTPAARSSNRRIMPRSFSRI
jgi:arylsulfatase A-like enzyme